MAVCVEGSGSRPKVWPVEKYARFVSTTGSSAGGSTAAKKADGKWQVSLHFSR